MNKMERFLIKFQFNQDEDEYEEEIFYSDDYEEDYYSEELEKILSKKEYS
jgi:hypothetical protein